MIPISQEALSLLQYKDVQIRPIIEINSAKDYIFRFSTDSDIQPLGASSSTDFNEELALLGSQYAPIYPLLTKLPKMRNSVDLVNKRKFKVSSMQVAVQNTQINNFVFADALKDYPIYNQECKYYMVIGRDIPTDDQDTNKVLLYTGIVTNIKKTKNTMTLTIEDQSMRLANEKVPLRRVNQSQQELKLNNGKRIPFTYGERIAPALLTNVNGTDTRVQCDRLDQYQDIPAGPTNSESTEVLMVSAESTYNRINSHVNTDDDLIIGNWCSAGFKQYTNTHYGVDIHGGTGSAWDHGTLYVSHTGTIIGFDLISPESETNGANYITNDAVTQEGYNIRWRPIDVFGFGQGPGNPNATNRIQTKDAELSTEADPGPYTLYSHGSNGQYDYRMGVTYTLTTPNLSNALADVEYNEDGDVIGGRCKGMRVSPFGQVIAGWAVTGSTAIANGDTTKALRVFLSATEETDESSTLPYEILAAPMTYYTGSNNGYGQDLMSVGNWQNGNASMITTETISTIHFVINGHHSQPYEAAHWMELASCGYKYQYFLQNPVEEAFYVHTKGRLDRSDLKYTGGNIIYSSMSAPSINYQNAENIRLHNSKKITFRWNGRSMERVPYGDQKVKTFYDQIKAQAKLKIGIGANVDKTTTGRQWSTVTGSATGEVQRRNTGLTPTGETYGGGGGG